MKKTHKPEPKESDWSWPVQPSGQNGLDPVRMPRIAPHNGPTHRRSSSKTFEISQKLSFPKVDACILLHNAKKNLWQTMIQRDISCAASLMCWCANLRLRFIVQKSSPHNKTHKQTTLWRTRTYSDSLTATSNQNMIPSMGFWGSKFGRESSPNFCWVKPNIQSSIVLSLVFFSEDAFVKQLCVHCLDNNCCKSEWFLNISAFHQPQKLPQKKLRDRRWAKVQKIDLWYCWTEPK